MQADAAHRRLRELILAGDYAPGQRLTEMEVSATLAMSRTPVREAFRALVSDGLVAPDGRGVAVVALGAGALRDAYQVRAALEAMTADLAARRQAAGEIAPAALAALRREADAADEATRAAHGATDAAARAGHLARGVAHNRRFHQRIAALAGNPVATGILDRLWDQIVVSTRDSLASPARPAHVAHQHDTLLAAITEGRAADAWAAAHAHVLDTHTAGTHDPEEQS
ncbi:GntR family transcriptional regulator [Longispora fulva]|uniref:DNA-binding GntR family transcriptional regulator n=1 Tax=Longispora fulva TaxID=619741 RepID=A0A8J7KKX6_9ACTN|nr:GntR family transcriptional regulator [Longispora fulva]MBG6137271.1 DNA-binding GntR family transcriptional regulator [Longispora fulva]GIG61376.1 GntR family transcriptional regulator [Longispora fulva]